MSGDDKSVEFPKAEVAPEERARRLRSRWIGWPACRPPEWMFGSMMVSPKSTASRAPSMKDDDRGDDQSQRGKAREDKAEDRQREQRAEKKEKKESTARREEERKRQREQERADKEAESARKEAERIEREQEIRRKKREAVFAEIAKLATR